MVATITPVVTRSQRFSRSMRPGSPTDEDDDEDEQEERVDVARDLGEPELLGDEQVEPRCDEHGQRHRQPAFTPALVLAAPPDCPAPTPPRRPASMGSVPAAIRTSRRRASRRPVGWAADGEAPGWCGAMRTRSTPGRMRKTSGVGMTSASPSTPTGTSPSDSMTNSVRGPLALDAPVVGARHDGADDRHPQHAGIHARPRARAHDPAEPVDVVGHEDRQRPSAPGARPGRSSAAPGSTRAQASLASIVGHGVEDGPDLGVAVAVALHRLRVEAERDVVDERPAAHLAEVDALLAPVDEGLEGADDVVAIDAEVEREVVAGPGRDAGERAGRARPRSWRPAPASRRRPRPSARRPHAPPRPAPARRGRRPASARSARSRACGPRPRGCCFRALPPPDFGFQTTTGRSGRGAVGRCRCTEKARLASTTLSDDEDDADDALDEDAVDDEPAESPDDEDGGHGP